MASIPVQTILEMLDDESVQIIGSAERVVTKPRPIHEAEAETDITFCNRSDETALELMSASGAGVILCLPLEGLEPLAAHKTLIVTQNPRLHFLRIVQHFFVPPKPQGIHPSAVIDPEAVIDPTAYIGPLTYVGKSEIGSNSVIMGHVYIYDDVKIGRNVTIHAGTVIGADGFGYERNAEGELEKFPHVGGVVIEDDVEIGSNTSIDRGTLGNTILRTGSKIDNLVHIAHNVVVGRHAVVIAHALIGGSTIIGDQAWIAPCACVRDKLTIGQSSIVGLGAVVVKDVADNVTVMGNPAYPSDDYRKMLKVLKQQADVG
jgi:UDP-3-O-[3-hydroxymyristoyl] glucosamine N-acyltransferase